MRGEDHWDNFQLQKAILTFDQIIQRCVCYDCLSAGDSIGSFYMTVHTEIYLLALEVRKWIISAGPFLCEVLIIFLFAARFILFVERAINWLMCPSQVLVFIL